MNVSRLIAKGLSVVAMASAIVAATTKPAEAVAWLRIEEAGFPAFEFSGGATGTVNISGAYGTFTLTADNSATKPSLGTPGSVAEMHLNSFDISTSTAGTLYITWADTDFDLGSHAVGATTTTGGIISGAGSITEEAWVNLANHSPLPDLVDGVTFGPAAIPAGSTVVYGPTTFGVGAFSGTGGASFTTTGPFAMFQRLIITFGAGGGNASTDIDTTASVPEPGSIALLGTGLVGLARAIRRRRAK